MSNEGIDFEHEKSESYSELPTTNEIKPEQELFDKSTEGTESDSTRRDEALSKEEIRQELFGESTENMKHDRVGSDEALSKEEEIRQELFDELIEGIECDRVGSEETSSKEEEIRQALFSESMADIENVATISYDVDNPSDENKDQKAVLDNPMESVSGDQSSEIPRLAEINDVEESEQVEVNANVEKENFDYEHGNKVEYEMELVQEQTNARGGSIFEQSEAKSEEVEENMNFDSRIETGMNEVVTDFYREISNLPGESARTEESKEFETINEIERTNNLDAKDGKVELLESVAGEEREHVAIETISENIDYSEGNKNQIEDIKGEERSGAAERADDTTVKLDSLESKVCEELEIEVYTQETLERIENLDVFRKSAINHIFNGEINRRGQATGYHYEGIENSSGKIIDGTKNEKDNNGVYEAKVEVNGISKAGNGGMSSFYPENLTPQEVIDAINQAYDSRVNLRGNAYVGESDGGLEIEMYLDADNKIISAFPIYKGDE